MSWPGPCDRGSYIGGQVTKRQMHAHHHRYRRSVLAELRRRQHRENKTLGQVAAELLAKTLAESEPEESAPLVSTSGQLKARVRLEDRDRHGSARDLVQPAHRHSRSGLRASTGPAGRRANLEGLVGRAHHLGRGPRLPALPRRHRAGSVRRRTVGTGLRRCTEAGPPRVQHHRIHEPQSGRACSPATS